MKGCRGAGWRTIGVQDGGVQEFRMEGCIDAGRSSGGAQDGRSRGIGWGMEICRIEG